MSLASLKELVVLGAIRAHPAHGYGLAGMLLDGVGWTVGLTRPTIYSILRRLEQRGWVEFETAKDSNYPERQIYRLSGPGEGAYFALLHKCARSENSAVVPLVGVLAHLDDLPVDEQQEIVEGLLQARRTQLVQLEDFPPHDGHAGAAVSLMLGQLRLEIETLEGLLVDG